MVVRTLATLAFLLGAIILVPACDGGLSNSEAAERCEEIQLQQANCMTTETLSACITCFEDCGDSCTVLETVCPTQFACVED